MCITTPAGLCKATARSEQGAMGPSPYSFVVPSFDLLVDEEEDER
jgi:hypothetical protein